MNRKISWFMIMIMIITTSACSKPMNQEKEKVEITVAAAASLTDALLEAETKFENKHPGIDLLFNFAGSGALQQQITQGAPVDLFFSAAKDQFDVLVKNEQINDHYKNDLLGNRLVLIVPKKSKAPIESIDDLMKKDIKRIAIGTPETVPAGKYTKELLQSAGIWGRISNKLVMTKDVKQVLTYVETNNVDTGLVYSTDALVSKKVKIVAEADVQSHSPIIYPVGIVKSTNHLKETKQFYEFLLSDEAKQIFTKYGFLIQE